MTVMFTMLFSRPKAAAGNERASDPAAEASWWRRHRHLLGGLAFGYVASLVMLWTAGLGSEWISATTAYFVAANLVVLWWYADTTRLLLESTRKQVAVSQAQYVHALRISRIGHKPFVVVEPIQLETGPGGDYREPDPRLSFRLFATSLVGHATAFAKLEADGSDPEHRRRADPNAFQHIQINATLR